MDKVRRFQFYLKPSKGTSSTGMSFNSKDVSAEGISLEIILRKKIVYCEGDEHYANNNSQEEDCIL